ncbi:MAG: hypothetical protein KGM17_01500 [Sphingomonadales bacterium]|nr:hypothetical protein [Sphingomonadales bacterium]
MDSILQRIEGAIGRLDAALRARAEAAGAAQDARAAQLEAENERLRGAVSGAISQIESLIVAAAPQGEDLPLWRGGNGAG